MDPMMKCGHRANAKNMETGLPVCAICIGIGSGGDVVDDSPPDMTNRMATCSYGCKTPPRPSTDNLAFFEHRPDKDTDVYYCGCYGWD